MRATKTSVLLLVGFTTSSALAGELRGRLLFGDGKPAAGVTVRAVAYEEPHAESARLAAGGPAPAPLASSSSGPDGRFALAVAAPDARYVVETRGGGAAGVRLDGVFEGSESEELAPTTLAKGETLSGKIVDGAGVPVEGAEVRLQPGPNGRGAAELVAISAKTGADGTFRFEGGDASANELSVEKEGFASARQTGVRPGALARAIVLVPGIALNGTVVRSGGKGPAKGALVRWEGTASTRWVETDENGRFTIANAPRGKGLLLVDGGDSGIAEVAHLSLPLPADKPLVATLLPAASLEGRVVDAKTLRALPRVKLLARESRGTRIVRSGPDGRYRLAPLWPGTLHLTADDPRYVLWTKDAIPLHPAASKSLDVVLVPGATIAGRVVDEKGAPVAEATGTLLKSGGPGGFGAIFRMVRAGGPVAPAFRTGPDGSFRATRLAPGDGQKLSVAHPDFEMSTLAGLSLPPGGVKAGVSVVLKRGASITGRVHDKDGNPIAGVEISVRQDFNVRGGRRGLAIIGNAAIMGNDRPSATSGPDGRFAVAGRTPGEWALSFTKRGLGTETVTAKVAEDRTSAPLDVTLGPAAAIAGFLRSRSGAPVEGLIVMARSGGGPMSGTAMAEPSGSDGAFVIEALKAGRSYDLNVIGRGGLGTGKSGVLAPSEGVEIVAAGVGRITGRAIDEKSGRPLVDFTVAAEPDNPGGRAIRIASRAAGPRARALAPTDAVHDEDGAFVLDEVPAGTWSVVVESKGYQAARVGGVVVEEGATKENVEVRVSPGGALTGRVLDGRSGRGVPEASVSAASASGGNPIAAMLPGLDEGTTATTDADGKYTIDSLAPGRYKVTATHPDYAEGSESAEVKETGGTADIHLAAGSALGGVVVNAARQPVPGADVVLSEQGEGGFGRGFGLGGGPSTTTDGSGRFRFDHLTPGRFQATAELSGKTTTPLDVVVAAGDDREDLVLSLGAGITIRGVVSGLPQEQLSGVTVNGNGPDGWGGSSRTGADGSFELTGAPAGAINLRAQAGDFLGSMKSASKQVVATDDQPVLTTEIVFDAGYTISGRVTKSGQPLAGASVNANSPGGGGRSASSRSDDSGAYRLEGLPAGRYSVTAISNFSAPTTKSQTVDLSSDQTLDIDFPIARIAGTVVESGTKRPLSEAGVSVSPTGAGVSVPGGMRQVQTDSNGAFALEGLEAASYTLTTQKADYLLDKRDVSAADQGSDAVVVELTRGQGIGIQVRDGISGIPLRSVSVRVSDTAQRLVLSTTVSLDSDGVGEIPSLPSGTYALWLDADGYAPATLASVPVPSQTVPVIMTPGGAVEIHAGPKTLATGSASIQVLTAAGAPYQLGMFGGGGRVTLTAAIPVRRLEHLAPGSYSAVGPTGPQPFQVQEGQTTIVTLP